jgi:hypothetical protein
VTILKGGEVTFQIHGGGHAMAIYEVSKDTTRDELGQFLCAGVDPATIPTTSPLSHVCNGTTPAGASNAAAQHLILDGHGDVVIVAAENVTNVHPDNRVWSEPGRLMSAGGIQFLNGGHHPRRSQFQRRAGDVSVPQDQPLPGHLHESLALPERLDVWFRQRDRAVTA